MKIALIGVNPFNSNRGVGALCYSLLYLLEQIANKYNIKFEYYLLSVNPSIIGEHKITIDNTNIRFTILRQCTQNGIKGLAKKIIFWKHCTQYSTFDYVFDTSEGDSFSDIYGDERFYFHNSVKWHFIKKQILVMLLPQTIGPFNNLKIKNKAIKTIERCDMVLARDRQSFSFLQNETNQKKVDEIIDMAFFMPYKKKMFSKESIHVGINISSLLWHGGYTKDNQFKLNVDYQSLIKKIIDCFLEIPTVIIHFVPHVVETDYTIENDYAVSFELSEKYKSDKIIVAPFFLTPILAKNYIAGFDFFIGARMHATIAAFSSLVPVYPMAYSRKFNGLFSDTLAYPYLGDMTIQSENEIIIKIIEAFKERDILRNIIQERMNTIVIEREKKLKRYITEFLGLHL
jgi:polysaccharide pyruvyl transferase WcaK-like protein